MTRQQTINRRRRGDETLTSPHTTNEKEQMQTNGTLKRRRYATDIQTAVNRVEEDAREQKFGVVWSALEDQYAMGVADGAYALAYHIKQMPRWKRWLVNLLFTKEAFKFAKGKLAAVDCIAA
ncbi:MAG: hypothetical protein JWR69_87 [Pedosphaera sp.]|nr:hypothetical protein [Pedosphaera sp.]